MSIRAKWWNLFCLLDSKNLRCIGLFMFYGFFAPSVLQCCSCILLVSLLEKEKKKPFALIGHVDKSKYISIWSSDIIKCPSCTIYHKSGRTWLQGHSVSHLITGSLKLIALSLFFRRPFFRSQHHSLPHLLARTQATFILNFLHVPSSSLIFLSESQSDSKLF